MKGGQPLHLSQYKGKVVVMAFILTTCSHCQRTTGYLNKLQKELGAARTAGGGVGNRGECGKTLSVNFPSASRRRIRWDSTGLWTR